MESNVKLKEGFSQVCVWPGTVMDDSRSEEFEQWFLDNVEVRVQYLETILTNPDKDKQGLPVPETGGRQDVFFAIHNDDLMKFVLPKLQLGARWLEDVYGNKQGYLYPRRVALYQQK